MAEDAVSRPVGDIRLSASQGGKLHVLKHDDLFAVFDARGDFHGALHAIGPSIGADGLFQDDTRVLSKFVLQLHGHTPDLLGSSVGADNVIFTAHLTNPTFQDRDRRLVQHGQLYLLRRRLLWRRKLYEAILIKNFAAETVVVDLSFDVDADFRDVFELRGMARTRRGKILTPCSRGNCLVLAYHGLDGQVRTTSITFSTPVAIKEGRVVLPVKLGPGASRHIMLRVASDGDTTSPSRATFFTALKGSKREARRHISALRRVETSNSAFDIWIDRASADLALLLTELETGPYPYAGIPWFSVPFGRDAVVTALQTLWINPAIARGVLAYLSALQAAESSPFQSAEPGKIMHESRKGEMAALKEVPYGLYYGGADTTPLFVWLAGLYFRRTNDIEFCKTIWPALRAALDWIDRFGDLDGDGFVEYRNAAAGGLQNQGWKDSDDSIFHSDGALAQGAIALVEVQAYVVAAKRAAAELAEALLDDVMAARLTAEADALQRQLNEQFWCAELGTYAVALDGQKRPCRVRTSNPGHVLFCDVADPKKARQVGLDLMSQDLFNGWGVRTLASDTRRYNPMSYHNGTVWPHDCSIVAAGLSRYGMTAGAERIFTAMFQAACQFPNFRLPELFCGFTRHAGEGPVSYPSACTPQAWASGAVFLLLQAVLGIDIDARAKTVFVRNPVLPNWLDRVTIRGLPVGFGRTTIHITRAQGAIDVTSSDATHDLKVVHVDQKGAAKVVSLQATLATPLSKIC